MPHILSFSGPMGAGKDTIAPLVVEQLGITAQKVSFAEALREEIQKIINIIKTTTTPVNSVTIDMKANIRDIEKIVNLLQEDLKNNPALTPYDRTSNMRTVLQFWATEVRRAQNPDYWINRAFDKVTNITKKGESVYFTDTRFLNELEELHKHNAFCTKLIVDRKEQIQRIKKRNGITPTQAQLNHPSDTILLDNEDFNYKIDTTNKTIEEVTNAITKEAKNYYSIA